MHPPMCRVFCVGRWEGRGKWGELTRYLDVIVSRLSTNGDTGSIVRQPRVAKMDKPRNGPLFCPERDLGKLAAEGRSFRPVRCEPNPAAQRAPDRKGQRLQALRPRGSAAPLSATPERLSERVSVDHDILSPIYQSTGTATSMSALVLSSHLSTL